MPITIRPLDRHDYAGWSQLYAAYADFYQVEQTQAMRDQVWQWMYQASPLIFGLAAFDVENKLVGFLHYREFVRPLAAAMGGYVDDLFVMPEVRGKGVAAKLIQKVVSIGESKRWSVIRWMTADANAAARACYDKISEHTYWQTYEIKLVK